LVETLRLEIDSAIDELTKMKTKTVLLQMPSGLKRKAQEIADEIRNRTGAEVLISGDSCYGACDLPDSSLRFVDAVVQVGHSPIPSVRCSKPMIFIRAKISIDLKKALESAVHLLKSPVGLLSTAQHLHQLQETKSMLEEKGFRVFIGPGSGRIEEDGHILGCDYSSAKSVSDSVESFLLLGGGRFHAIGARLLTGKPVIIIDPERETAVLEDTDIDRFMRRRFAIIQKIKQAESLAIIVSSKVGQDRILLAQRLSKLASQKNRNCSIVIMDDLSPEKLLNLGFDAYISTACPRIALDDADRYEKPVGTTSELLVAIGLMDWENYKIDEWGFSI